MDSAIQRQYGAARRSRWRRMAAREGGWAVMGSRRTPEQMGRSMREIVTNLAEFSPFRAVAFDRAGYT
ncbi:MAG: hypothetical protein Kow0077_14780 [Anaerolineae bacterium]